MRVMWYLLGVPATVYVGFVLLLYVFQSRLVYYPETGREIIATPAEVGLSFESVRLTTSDAVRLHGWYIPAAQPRGTVLFLHGNAGNISFRLDYVQMFHRLGYSMLIFDYRGYGMSGGTPTEQGTYRDAEAAWHYLAVERGIPPCRIVVFGESMGGAIAAWLAARREPAALVIASSFTSVPDLGRDLYPFVPVRWLARIHYDTREYLRTVKAPVLIAHSPQDDIVPYRHGRALFDAANPPREFLELAGGHNDGFIFMRPAWVDMLGRFLDQRLEEACAR